MNVGKQRAHLDDPVMAEFNAATPAINALARATPGFIWSFDNDDPSVRLTVPELVADELLMPQLSVWADVESLRHFAFRSGHAMYVPPSIMHLSVKATHLLLTLGLRLLMVRLWLAN